MRAKAARTKPRWRSYAKPHPAPRGTGPLACDKRAGVHFFKPARALNNSRQVRTPNKKIAVVVCQRHSHTHTRAEFVSKHHRSSLLEAPLAWCAVRSQNSDPTSSGQAVATVNQNCGELFSIARLLRARERVRYASAPLSEDRTSVRGPQTENPPWARALNCLSRFGVASSWRHALLLKKLGV